MIHKRATEQLKKAGIKLNVKKCLYGYRIDNPNYIAQDSMCFPTAKKAVDAVINDGFRPTERKDLIKEATNE